MKNAYNYSLVLLVMAAATIRSGLILARQPHLVQLTGRML